MRILIFFLLASYVTFAQDYGCTDSNADNYEQNVSEVVFESPINTGINMTVGGDGVLGYTDLLVDDFVGAFFINNNGNFVCAGYSSLNIEGVGIIMTVYGNDSSTSVQDGFFQGQEMHFFIKRSDLDGDYIYPVSFSLLGESPNEQGSYISLPTTFNADQVALFDLFFIGENQVNCIYSSGCADPTACNYSSEGDCEYTSCLGCMDATACNYDADEGITIEDGSCQYININSICDICSGETDGSGIVIDNDTDNDGVCDTDEVLGCVDITACNYNTLATDADGSCFYDGPLCIGGCTFSEACNYNSLANKDDGS